MIGPLLAAGVAAQVIAWRLVVVGRAPFWRTVAAAWAILGAAALLLGDPACCADHEVTTAMVVGAASGVLLYGATRTVVTVSSRWPALAGAVDAAYGRSAEVAPAAAWILTLGVAVPGEEVFWRGVVTPWLVDATPPVAGAILAWAASAGVAAAWASIPFLAAAVVGGALWTALAIWSGGVLAPLASHLVWTACMIAWRPPAPRAKVAA